MSTPSPSSPLADLRVVEVALGGNVVGNGLAAHLPGSLLRGFGAEVVHIESAQRSSLDEGVERDRPWAHGKELVRVEDPADAANVVVDVARTADVLVLSGPERFLEGRGVTYAELAADNPSLVTARLRPSVDSWGSLHDHELLVHARMGLMGQLQGPRPGPVFCDVAIAGAGAAFAATAGVLARLYEREATGRGGWVETSLYDGVLAMLPMIIGRVENPTAATAMLWEHQGPDVDLSHRCRDGKYVQLWFGAKGAFEEFLEHIGDAPTEIGYQAEMTSGVMGRRSGRWAELFATRDREWWLEDLAGRGFRCDPVLRPGEILREQHLRATGLSIDVEDPEGEEITVVGPVGSVAATEVEATAAGGRDRERRPGAPLADVRIVDLSAYFAGPIAARILADLGADVVKVEPTSGDAHRNMEPLFAAAQRGKRSLALDLKHPDAAEILTRLFRWGDVVHHNSRVGSCRAARLRRSHGACCQSVCRLQPRERIRVVGRVGSSALERLRHASLDRFRGRFGGNRPAARRHELGVYRCCRRLGIGLLDPRRLVRTATFRYGPVREEQPDRSRRLAPLRHVPERRCRHGRPVVDPQLTGYGAAYRIYRGSDDRWFALVVPDADTWSRLREIVAETALPERPPPLRTPGAPPDPTEEALEQVFAGREVVAWVDELRAAGVPTELVVDVDRAEFAARLLDDPLNRQLGRVASYSVAERGKLEQMSLALRLGPDPTPLPAGFLPGLGAHTNEVLEEIGFVLAEREKFVATEAVKLG